MLFAYVHFAAISQLEGREDSYFPEYFTKHFKYPLSNILVE